MGHYYRTEAVLDGFQLSNSSRHLVDMAILSSIGRMLFLTPTLANEDVLFAQVLIQQVLSAPHSGGGSGTS